MGTNCLKTKSLCVRRQFFKRVCFRRFSVSLFFLFAFRVVLPGLSYIEIRWLPVSTLLVDVYFSADDYTWCTRGSQVSRQTRTCHIGSQNRNATPFNGGSAVLFHIAASPEDSQNLPSIDAFFDSLRKQAELRLSIQLQFLTDEHTSNVTATNGIAYRVAPPAGSRYWWETRLSAAGFSVRSTEFGLYADVLHKEKCGCICNRTAHIEYTQDGDSFAQEYSLNLTQSEHDVLNELRTHSLTPNLYGTCALVFSSSILNRAQPALGRYIDAHDAVIRLNHAPEGGIFTDVAGSRTTMRIMYVPGSEMKQQSMSLSPQKIFDCGESLQLLSVHYAKRARLLLEYNMSRPGGVSVIRTEVRERGSVCIFGDFYEHPLANRPPSGPHMSTGMIGLMVSLHVCERTVVFGKLLGLNESQKAAMPQHYFEDVPYPIGYAALHGASQEEEVLRQLRDSGTISLVPV